MTKICVSITSSTPEDLKNQIMRAFSYGADFVEIRFDFLMPADMQESLKIVESIRNRAVFTLRSVQQNGKFTGKNEERIFWLKQLALSQPMLLDVELHTLRDNDELVDFFTEQKTPILVSWHDFEKTPTNSELIDLLGEMRIYSNYVKLVTAARNVQDCIRLLDLYNVATELNLISFAMGEIGILSRILCTIYGNAPFTYAALEEAFVPGQLTIQQMRKLYDMIGLSSGRINARPV
ncbi:MAG: type I 3-dehydroquinate dehydratase [Candidatus Nitrosopolaris sp.]